MTTTIFSILGKRHIIKEDKPKEWKQTVIFATRKFKYGITI